MEAERLKALQIDSKTVWMLKKEVKTVLRSRWLLFGFMLSPMVAWLFQGAFLSFIVAQTSEEPEAVHITVEDNNTYGRMLYQAIYDNREALLIDPLVNVTRAEGERLVENKSMAVWVWIPENFTSSLESLNRSTMVMWVNTGSFRASAAAQRLDWFAKQVINEVIVIRDLEVRWETTSPEATYGHQLAIFLVMLTSVLAPAPYVSQSFAGERERHTLEALLVVPMSRIRILASKLAAGLLLTMIYSVFTVVGILTYNYSIVQRASGLPSEYFEYYVNLYSVQVQNLPLIFFCQSLVLVCAIGIGVVISCLAKDQATAESLNNMVLLVPTTVIGILGFTGSILQYGGLMGVIIMLIPFSHAIMFLNGVLSGVATAASLTVNVAYLLGFTVVTLVIGARLFEREAIIA
ncbi:MAG: ABC transporter permease [Candidatus Thorarchaeota archaeon]|nr:ABC transporter permease [Candidatus Thorarchaeota archaeon]